MIEKDAFIEDLETIERKLKFVAPRLKLLRIAYEGRNEALYPETLKIQTALENIAVKARNLPYFTWRTTARDDVRKVMMETIPHKIGFTKEGWFSVRIPMLLPKKKFWFYGIYEDAYVFNLGGILPRQRMGAFSTLRRYLPPRLFGRIS